MPLFSKGTLGVQELACCSMGVEGLKNNTDSTGKTQSSPDDGAVPHHRAHKTGVAAARRSPHALAGRRPKCPRHGLYGSGRSALQRRAGSCRWHRASSRCRPPAAFRTSAPQRLLRRTTKLCDGVSNRYDSTGDSTRQKVYKKCNERYGRNQPRTFWQSGNSDRSKHHDHGWAGVSQGIKGQTYPLVKNGQNGTTDQSDNPLPPETTISQSK